MKISKTYRHIARFLSVALFFGVVSPVVAQASMFMHCSTMMQESPVDHNSIADHDSMSYTSMEMNHVAEMNSDKDCLMTSNQMVAHHQNNQFDFGLNPCEMTIDCDCNLSDQIIKKEALLIQQFKVPVLSVSFINSEFLNGNSTPSPIPIYFSNSYSPSILFLANESFLI